MFHPRGGNIFGLEAVSRGEGNIPKGTVGDPDQDILASLRAGDRQAFATLVNRHKDRAMTYAVRIVRRREDAEEIVQDAFVRAYRSIDSFRGESRLGTWLMTILHNCCMSHVGRKRAAEVPMDDEGEGPALTLASEDADPLQLVEESERTALLTAQLLRLPTPYRAVLTLFYVQELQYEEISRVMNLPLGTVKTHLFRARERLRKNLLETMRREAALS